MDELELELAEAVLQLLLQAALGQVGQPLGPGPHPLDDQYLDAYHDRSAGEKHY